MLRMRTVVASVMMLAATGCAQAPRAAAPVAIPATEPPLPPAPLQPPTSVIIDPLRICVVKDGRMEYVFGQYVPATGDTLVDGRPVHEAYPLTAAYASKTDWFARDNWIVYQGLHYKYGLPRTLNAGDVVPVGVFRGVTVFADPADKERIVFYIPVDPFCMFQPYELEQYGGAVRG
jgi:hypothetical protein